jgi:hypothetical protein
MVAEIDRNAEKYLCRSEGEKNNGENDEFTTPGRVEKQRPRRRPGSQWWSC